MRPRSKAFAFVTFVSISTGRWTRTRHSRWRESLRTTPGCGAVVVGHMLPGLTPSATTERVATARVRRGAIARCLCLVRLMPLGRHALLLPRRLPCLGRRLCAMYVLARPVARPCRQWPTPGSSRSPACGPRLSARTGGASSVPCPLLDRLWLAPVTATPTTGDSRSTWRIFSRRRRPRRPVLTRRASSVVGPMRVGVLREGLRSWRDTRVRVVSRMSRGTVLARAVIAAVTRAGVMKRRSECHCKVGGSVDCGGDAGRVPFLCFVFLVCFCRLTCLRPLPSFLLVIISMKEVAGQHGPWCGSRIPCVC